MFDQMIREVANKEISEIASEVIEKKQLLHSQFETGLEAVDGKFSSRIDNCIEGGYRYIRTKNEPLEGGVHPITGVPFERKIIEIPNGEKVEGVFPKFDSMFDAKISEELYLKPDKVQFRECNRQLLEAVENNLEFASKFSPEQLEQIRDGVIDGTAPDGYVWHHDAESGKLQLVDFDIHQKTGHTGGREVWGGGGEYR